MCFLILFITVFSYVTTFKNEAQSDATLGLTQYLSKVSLFNI